MAKKTDWTDWYSQLESLGKEFDIDVFGTDIDEWESESHKGKEPLQALTDKFPEIR